MRERSRYAFLMDDLFAVTLWGTFSPVMPFIVVLCLCLREASRNEGCEKMRLVVLRATWISKTGFQKDCYPMGMFI